MSVEKTYIYTHNQQILPDDDDHEEEEEGQEPACPACASPPDSRQTTPALGAGGVYFPFSMFSLQFTRTSFLSCSVQILMPLTERSRQATANTAMTRRKKQATFPGNILLS